MLVAGMGGKLPSAVPLSDSLAQVQSTQVRSPLGLTCHSALPQRLVGPMGYRVPPSGSE